MKRVSSYSLFWGGLLYCLSADLIALGAAFRPPRIFHSTRRLQEASDRPARLFATSPKDESSPSSSNLQNFYFRPNKQNRDVVIVGGALAGLSAALYLSQIDPTRHITILDRETYGKTRDEKSKHAQPASFAAAGMLAPQSERLPPGPLLDLCISSRRMFSDFCDMVESLAQESGEEGAPYLFPNEFQVGEEQDQDLDPWSVGYVGSGGFLAPAFAGDSVATWAPPEEYGSAMWLDATQVRELEPTLHPDVVGGWWFPDDASVDARRLTCSLRAACVAAGVQILSGPQYEVSSLDLVDGKCQGLWLTSSSKKRSSSSVKGKRYISANTVLIANGAWMRNLLPVPIEPHKGQSLSLRMPSNQPPILRRVLFAQDSYIVPKADGRIVIGATVEAGSYDPSVTSAGLMHILTHALQLVPALKDLPIEETWVGLRPTTPDKGPILGATPWKNLLVAGGYWRNGVLLAPKTGQLLASLIASNGKDSSSLQNSQDAAFLNAFAWDRFTSREGSTKLAANARYAASMHPIHKRSSAGVSAAVGTELGSYSSARAAVDDRQRDREALWKTTDGGDDEDAAFERAAALGKQDGAAFITGDESTDDKSWSNVLEDKPEEEDTSEDKVENAMFYEGSADALTVGAASSSDDDLESAYEAIQKNKAKSSPKLGPSTKDDKRPDPGFRIFHVDSDSGDFREVPPYTTPGEFETMVNKGEIPTSNSKGKKKSAAETAKPSDTSQINDAPNGASSDELDSVYQAIQRNKAEKGAVLDSTDMNNAEEQPDPGFRVYHVDPNTKQKREVPPYTSPGDFLASIGTDSTEKILKGSPKPPPSPVGLNGDTKHDVNDDEEYSSTTFDGYQDIQQANSRSSRQEELDAMREARRRNRLGQEKIDPSKIGAVKRDDMA